MCSTPLENVDSAGNGSDGGDVAVDDGDDRDVGGDGNGGCSGDADADDEGNLLEQMCNRHEQHHQESCCWVEQRQCRQHHGGEYVMVWVVCQ